MLRAEKNIHDCWPCPASAFTGSVSETLPIHETRAIAVLGPAGTPPRLRASASTSELSKITLPRQLDRRDAAGGPG
jgi:hypothetical protein